jgi:transcriptional regulator with XRE-family HTH domain
MGEDMALQRHKRMRANPQSLGGTKLQELRNAARFSLMELATRLENDLGKPIDTAHINKIETGNIKKPLIETLETILAGLQASYRDRRDVLEAFGYQMPMALPTAQEIDEAIRLTGYELNDSTYPIMLIDYSQRIWAWNQYTPRIIGLHPDDPATTHFIGATVFDVTLNPAFTTRLLIANPDEYLPIMLQFIKAGMYRYHTEPWYRDLMTYLGTFPGFSAMWDSLPADTLQRYSYRSIVPIKIDVSGASVMQFRMSSTDFLLDPRFQIIHFTPFGAHTLRACAQWAEEEGVL